MSGALVLVHLPPRIRAGDVIEVRATIGHPMETGFRPGADGRLLARNLIERFSCFFNGERVFSARLFAAVAANPYLAFYLQIPAEGKLRLHWQGEHGFSHVHEVDVRLS